MTIPAIFSRFTRSAPRRYWLIYRRTTGTSISRLWPRHSAPRRAVIASHLHGGLISMRELTALAAGHGAAVIEDAAQAPGAMIQGRRAGAWGDIGVLSFGGSKLLDGRTRRRPVDRPRRPLSAAALVACTARETCFIPYLNFKRLCWRRNSTGLMNTTNIVVARSPFWRSSYAMYRAYASSGRAWRTAKPCYYKVGFQFDAGGLRPD